MMMDLQQIGLTCVFRWGGGGAERGAAVGGSPSPDPSVSTVTETVRPPHNKNNLSSNVIYEL